MKKDKVMKRILICLTVTLLLGLGVPAHATVTGQWDFNSSNLVATVGTDLAYRGDTESCDNLHHGDDWRQYRHRHEVPRG